MQIDAHPELGVNSIASVDAIRPVMGRKAKRSLAISTVVRTPIQVQEGCCNGRSCWSLTMLEFQIQIALHCTTKKFIVQNNDGN